MKNYINKSNELLLLIVIVLFGFILRIYALSDVPSSLYIDEIWSVYNPYLAEKGLLDLSLRGNAVHFLMGNYFTYSLFGASAFFARLPSVIFGTGLVLIVYLLSKDMFSKRAGLTAAMLTALSPWGIQFSRYSVPASNYVFFFVLSLYLMYKGIKMQDERKKFVYCGAGSIILGLVTYTHIVSLAFISVFLFGFILIFTKKLDRTVLTNGLKYFSLGLLSASLTIYEYLNPMVLSNAGSRVSGSYSVFSLSKNLWDLIVNVFERMYYHLSPDFLVTTGGVAFVSNTGFSETISRASLLRYGTNLTGVLNYYGVILYPALIYLLYKFVKRTSSKEEQLLLWWILAYAAASSVSYYDNPNAARNIVGLPAMIIVIALFIYRGFNFVRIRLRAKSFLHNSKIIPVVLSLTIITSIAIPTSYYVTDYFTEYPVRSAKEFNYGYKMVADYLNTEQLWNNTLYVRTDVSLWYSPQLLAFYSPNQPPSNIFAIQKIESSWPFQEASQGSLFITQFESDFEKLGELGIAYERKQDFNLPSGEDSLHLVELSFPDTFSPIKNSFTKEEYRIAVFDYWSVGRSPKGLNLEMHNDVQSGLVISYDYNGNHEDWWYCFSTFEDKINLAQFPLFAVNWNFQGKGSGSKFIQFLVETQDGQTIWVSNNRLEYPAKRYLLHGILRNYTSIVGVMVGGDVQTGETGEIILSEMNFFRVPEVDINSSQDSKWNWVDVEEWALLINGNTSVNIPVSPSEVGERTKYLMFSIMPFHEGNVFATVVFDDNSVFETNFSYLKNRLETNQKYLLVFNNSECLQNLTIKTESPALLFGIYSGC